MSTPDKPYDDASGGRTNDQPPPPPESDAAAHVRFLARHGLLADRAREASASDYARLCRGAYEIIWPVVFDGLTRGLERRRGHACANGIAYLEADCLDRFQDDVEAVLDYLLRHADGPIYNLEGWVRSRLVQATVDGHRRRRGERGALQRPRLPKWLQQLIGDDPWLRTLAIDILTWVGVSTTAGTGVWPYAAWAERRAAVTGDVRGTEQDVARDVETVLALMRHDRVWYERFVERPLGRKQAPTLAADDAAIPGLSLVDPYESHDARLQELATVAIDVITIRIRRGEDPRSVVADVIGTAFGATLGPVDQAPGADDASDTTVTAFLSDQAAIDRLVGLIFEILDGKP